MLSEIKRLAISGLAAAAALLLNSCGSDADSLTGAEHGPRVSSPPEAARSIPARPPLSSAPFALPSPGQLLAQRGASFSLAEGFSSGSDFDAGMPNNRVNAVAATGAFVPAFGASDSGLGNLAYAVYAFTLPDYNNDAPVDIQLTFSDAPAAGDCFVALSDFDGGLWTWFDLPGDGRLAFPGFSEYISPSDIHLLCVAVKGSDAAILDSVQLSTAQAPVASIVPDKDSGVAPLTVNFDASASMDPDGTIVKYEWDLDGDGLFNESGSETNAFGSNAAANTYSAFGSYNVTVRVTDDGDFQDEATVQINVSASQPPVADLQANPLVGDKPVVVTFNATASMDPDGTVTDYEWDFDGDTNFNEADNGEDTAQSDPTPPDVTYTAAGVFDATVRVTDNDGGKDTATVQINVANTPPNAVIQVGTSEGDAPFQTSFSAEASTDPGGTITDYEWDFDGDGLYNEVGTQEETARGNSAPADIDYNTPGIYSAAVRVTDDDDATDSDSVAVSVHGWVTVPVDDPPADDAGYWGDIALVNGNPAIAWRNGTSNTLRYARSTSTTGALPVDWSPITISTTGVGSPGREVSLAVISGNPALSYCDNNVGDLWYHRATTANGDSAGDWTIQVQVDSANDVGYNSELLQIGGSPAIVYDDITTGELTYCRASTMTGGAQADWSSKIDIDGVGSSSAGAASLAVINGNPAVVYYYYDGMGNSYPRYCRSSTADGALVANWGTKLNLAGPFVSGTIGYSLATVSGFPAVSWSNSDTGAIQYCRATDANGAAAWSAAVNVEAMTTSSYTSLFVINGLPAIAYHDQDPNDLAYSPASSATGGNAGDWTQDEVVDGTVTSVGRYSTLILVDGDKPAIYYRNDGDFSCRYAVRF